MECNFVVGQKVVCVDDSIRPGRVRQAGHDIRKGQIYTVYGFQISRSGDLNVELVELPHPNGYFPSRFRPVTDISDPQKLVADVFTKTPAIEPVMRLTKLGRDKLAALGIDPKDVRIES